MPSAPGGPLQGLLILDISTVVAAPWSATLLADLGRHRGEGGDARARRSAARAGTAQGWRAAVVEGDQPQQEGHHPRPAQAGRARLVRTPAAALRRAGGEFPPRHAGQLGPRQGPPVRLAAEADHPARQRLRSDRPLSAEASFRPRRRGAVRLHLYLRRARPHPAAHGLSGGRRGDRPVRRDRHSRRACTAACRRPTNPARRSMSA